MTEDNKIWSETDLHDLEWSARRGRSVEEIADYLGRSIAEVRAMAVRLGLELHGPEIVKPAPENDPNLT